MKKILSAVTVSESSIFFYGQMEYLRKHGFTLVFSSSDGKEVRRMMEKEPYFDFIPIAMLREPSAFQDLIALAKVTSAISHERPNIVNAGTPKAGFLFMIGAFLNRVPVRIYHVRGFRHESMSGLSRKFQKTIERLSGALATHIVCETTSVRNLGIEEGLFPARKCHVLGPGSSGIELDRYDPGRFTAEDNRRLRESLGIPAQALVLGYVGRLVPRKGITELIDAWRNLREDYPALHLVLVGPEEAAQPLPETVRAAMRSDPRISLVGMVSDPAPYYAIMDVFTLPAHWEGFGNVVVEAAAMGKPVVSTTGTGTRDAVSDGFNGLLVPVKDSVALEGALRRYLDSAELREAHGRNGKEWAKRFSRQAIFGHLRDFYLEILGRREDLSGVPGRVGGEDRSR